MRALRAVTTALIVVVIALFIVLGLISGAPPVAPAAVIAGVVVGAIWRFRDRVPARLRLRSVRDALVVFFVVLFASAALLDYTVNLPRASAEAPRLAAAFAAIPQPPLTRRVSYSSWTKSDRTVIEGLYQAAAGTWTDLRGHFDSALIADGWSFLEEHGVREWGQDFGGRTACYAKGQDRAQLWFPGRADPSYTYSFSIAWQIGRRPSCF